MIREPVSPYAQHMEQSQVLKRVVGILTRAVELHRLLEEDVDREDLGEADIIETLLSEALPTIEIPSGATVEEITERVGREAGAAVFKLVNAFSLAFVKLAKVHDSGESDVSSADVLRDLALLAERLGQKDR